MSDVVTISVSATINDVTVNNLINASDLVFTSNTITIDDDLVTISDVIDN